MNESLLAYPFLEKKKRKGLFRIKNVYLKQQYAFFFLQAIISQTILDIFTVIWPDCFVVALKQFRYNTIFTRYSVKINKRKKF